MEEKDHQFPLFQRNPSVKPHESRYNLPRTKTLRSTIPPPDTQHPVNPTSRTLQQPHKPAQSIPHTLEEIRTVGSNREGHRPQVRPGGVLHEAVSDRDIVAAPIADTWRRPWRWQQEVSEAGIGVPGHVKTDGWDRSIARRLDRGERVPSLRIISSYRPHGREREREGDLLNMGLITLIKGLRWEENPLIERI